MKLLSITTSLSIFVSLSSALPQLQCYTNKCDLLVRLKGKQACSSFLKTTVTPCPVTSTVTATPIVTVTSATTTTEFTTEQSVVVITPAPDTATTTTTTFTATSTLRATPVVQNVKRTGYGPRRCPSTCSPSKVPAFAYGADRVCKTAPAFASACKCLGIKPQTTTLSASTVFTTVTTTQTVQETSLTTVTVTTTEETTTTATPSTTTVTSTISTASTALASPTSCFLIRDPAGHYGQMLGNGRFAFQISSASAFSLTDGDGTTGYLYDYFFRQTVGGVPPTPEEYPNDSIRFLRLVDINGPLATSVQCVRAAGALQCVDGSGAQSRFVQCRSPGPLNNESELLLLTPGFPVPDGCQEITPSVSDVDCPPL